MYGYLNVTIKINKIGTQCRTEQWRKQDFPLGGAEPLGGADLQCGHFLAKMYAKTKELDPVGGGGGHTGGAPWIRQC